MLRLRDIMTTDLVTVPPELTVRDAMDLLATHHLSGAPVVEGTRVVGVISMTDLVGVAASLAGAPTRRTEPPEAAGPEAAREPAPRDERAGLFFAEPWAGADTEIRQRIGEPGGPVWNALEEHKVSEVMSRVLKALPPDTPVDRAADFMRAAAVRRVLVMDGDALVGVVSATDIADAVADRKLASHIYHFGRSSD